MGYHAAFGRTELMLGTAALDALAHARVAVFGLGGVGGWCAESLVRSGVGKLLLVDSDSIAESNVNRQVMATTATVGQPKANVLARRFREINPLAKLDVRMRRYTKDTAGEFSLEDCDYVIDAIDSVDCKAELIRHALSIPSVTLFASMGAALKMDPFQVRATEFRKVEGDGLARALRTRFKTTGGMPNRKFVCVWSPERRDNIGPACEDGETGKRVNGTVVHTTAIFGFALAGLVVRDVERKVRESP